MTVPPQNVWRLDGHIARFQVSQLQATVDVLRPAAGLQISFSQWRDTPECSLLRVSLPDRELDYATAGVDFFVRGGDLVATYEETPEHPLRGAAGLLAPAANRGVGDTLCRSPSRRLRIDRVGANITGLTERSGACRSKAGCRGRACGAPARSRRAHFENASSSGRATSLSHPMRRRDAW